VHLRFRILWKNWKYHNWKRYFWDKAHHDVVYKISCHDCDASYIVRQTKGQLKTRIAEHALDIKSINLIKKSDSPNIISKHWISLNHNFDWNNVRILEFSESSYNKILIFEMIFIRTQKNRLNLQSDTESLPEIYSSIIALSPSWMFPSHSNFLTIHIWFDFFVICIFISLK